jgi:protein-tyrosine phosphatase
VHGEERSLRKPSVELHFHLLNGVDDGPTTMEDSLELARAAVAQGTGTVVATPHVRPDFVTDPWELPGRVTELRAALAAEAISLTVVCGGEIGHEMVGRLGQAELELLAQGPSGRRWLLVEAPFEKIDDEFHAATSELRARGFGVLIAHPERSADAILDDAQGLRRELASGSLSQLNAQSLTGDHGFEARRAAVGLAEQGLATVVASDAHGPTRPPALLTAEAKLAVSPVGAEVAAKLTYSAPRALLSHGFPLPSRPLELRPRPLRLIRAH